MVREVASGHPGPSDRFSAVFDGHSGNLASKYAASFLYQRLMTRLEALRKEELSAMWRQRVREETSSAFKDVHEEFLRLLASNGNKGMAASGTTATIVVLSNDSMVVANLGDSRAVLVPRCSAAPVIPTQLTRDHVASDPDEKVAVESRGGTIINNGGIDRVDGYLAVTRSIGDAQYAPVLSQVPEVSVFSKDEVEVVCGRDPGASLPCFAILASDGIWDKVRNEEAVRTDHSFFLEICLFVVPHGE